ncbi:MAG TPA: crossover junction endodeoxyribonuclease RuvC [Pirellulales bacterium]|jgi:crossover junction endodeoxyribonuclease RuvC|nr:crossover junction endodeoxyribonuclease RuvC [Pirellulales bacterium]
MHFVKKKLHDGPIPLALPSSLAPRPSPLILGIDPGLAITGYGVLEATRGTPRLVEAGVVRSTEKTSELPARLAEIHRGVAEVIAALKPAAMALEQLYSHYDHPRTSILMGHARGVICLAAAEAGIPVIHYSATQIKRILTGNGRAPKSQVQRAIEKELRLDRPPEPPDVADALAVALCHYHLGRRQSQLLQGSLT